MRKVPHILLLIALVLLWATDGFAGQPTVEERLIRLEEGQKALVQRIEDTNRRIDDLRADMNQRFEDLRFWLQMIAGILVLVMGGLIAQWLVMWRRLIRVDISLGDHLRETEKDRLLALQQERLQVLEERLARIEAGRMG